MNDERMFELLAQHHGSAEVATDFADTLFDRLRTERRRRFGWLGQWMGPLALPRSDARRLALLVAVVALLLAATIIALALANLPRIHPIAAVGGNQLVVAYDDGSQRTVFDRAADVVGWDRQGERILFTNRGVAYVVRTDGSGPRSVLHLEDYDGITAADWSPGGDRIALAIWNLATLDARFRVVVVEPDNPDDSSVTLHENASGPEWSPDGSLIGFIAGNLYSYHEPGDSGESIWVASSQDWTPRQIAAGEPKLELVSWSPDSRWLLYRTWDDINFWSLWIVRPDGSERRRLYSGKGAWLPPLWLADSSAIALDGPQEEDGDTIDIVDITGTSKRISPKMDWRVYGITLLGTASDRLVWQATGGGFRFLASTSVSDESSQMLGDASPIGQLSWDRDELSWVHQRRNCLETFQINGGITVEHCLNSNYDENEVTWVGRWP